MLGRILGIEMGNQTIKLMQVSKKRNRLIIEKYAILPTPRDCLIKGQLVNVEPIYEVIERELIEQKYKAKKAVVILQSSSTIIRNVEIDKRPEKVIKQMIALKPQDYLPIESDQYQIDFKIIREIEEEENPKVELLLAATPNQVIVPLVNLIESLHLKPILLTIPSEALAKAFHPEVGSIILQEQTVLVLDVGGKETTATILCEERAVLTRNIAFGVEGLKEQLMALEETKIQFEGYDNSIEGLLVPEMEYTIISEVERLLQFYESHVGKKPVTQIYLIGGGAKIPAFVTQIEESIHLPVTTTLTLAQTIEGGIEPLKEQETFFVKLLGVLNTL